MASNGRQVQDAFTSALAGNEAWSSAITEADPNHFPTSEKAQYPKILWIGCADSRVPPETILGLKPGSVFVHRNISNILHPTDLSSLSVIDFAVANLKVQHIVVCGHTSCGGVAAALGNSKVGIIDLWIQPLRLLRAKHSEELGKLEGEEKKTRLAQLNVRNSVDVLKMNSTVIDAIKERGLQLHGAVYHLGTGKVEVIDVGENEVQLAKRITAFETTYSGTGRLDEALAKIKTGTGPRRGEEDEEEDE